MIYRLLVWLGAINMIFVPFSGSFAEQSAQQSLRLVAMGSSSIDRCTTYQSSPYTKYNGTFVDRSSLFSLYKPKCCYMTDWVPSIFISIPIDAPSFVIVDSWQDVCPVQLRSGYVFPRQAFPSRAVWALTTSRRSRSLLSQTCSATPRWGNEGRLAVIYDWSQLLSFRANVAGSGRIWEYFLGLCFRDLIFYVLLFLRLIYLSLFCFMTFHSRLSLGLVSAWRMLGLRNDWMEK